MANPPYPKWISSCLSHSRWVLFPSTNGLHTSPMLLYKIRIRQNLDQIGFSLLDTLYIFLRGCCERNPYFPFPPARVRTEKSWLMIFTERKSSDRLSSGTESIFMIRSFLFLFSPTFFMLFVSLFLLFSPCTSKYIAGRWLAAHIFDPSRYARVRLVCNGWMRELKAQSD